MKLTRKLDVELMDMGVAIGDGVDRMVSSGMQPTAQRLCC